MALSDIAAADLDQMYRDWGQPASLVQVTRNYDPHSAVLDELETSHPVLVIPARDRHGERLAPAAPLPMVSIVFLLRESDISSGMSLTSARLRHGAVAYEIRAVAPARVSGVVALECVR